MCILPLITYESLHEILRTLFDKMLVLCGGMSSVAAAVGAIGALLYISYRVWQSIGRAEPLDIFPLLRPFALGICILFFNTLVIGGINGILSPVVKASHAMMRGQVYDMKEHHKSKFELEKEYSEEVFEQLSGAQTYEEVEQTLEEMGLDSGDLMALGNMYQESSGWNLRAMFQNLMRWLLEMLFEFASLVLDTIRTFYLIVLAILGPLAFAFSIFDGFQASLTHWMAKYVSVYLWLPISDIFGAILSHLQVLTLQKDMELIVTNPGYSINADNTVYLVFLFIGICGYFTIPSIASWIVQATGFGSYNRIVTRSGSYVLHEVTKLFKQGFKGIKDMGGKNMNVSNK